MKGSQIDRSGAIGLEEQKQVALMSEQPDIDPLLRAFAACLSSSWESVERIARDVTTNSFLQDWMQANWEMLVEGALPPDEVFLEVYGEGADCNESSSRVYRPEAHATHAVFCVARTAPGMVEDLLSNEPIAVGVEGLPLEEFVTMTGEWFARQPPFDCVLLDDGGQERVVSANSIRFVLSPATRG